MPRVIITVPEKNAQPYRFQLDRQSVTLGRGSDNDIAIDSGSVSVKHAEMRRIKGGYELRDKGSTNGIKLDGERYQTIPLHHGISVRLGEVAFDFILGDEEVAALADEKSKDGPAVEGEASGKSLPKQLPPLKEREEPRSPEPLSEAADEEGRSGFSVVLLLVLAVLAFAVGMAMRFHKETGGSLLHAITSPVKAPAPSVPEAPAATPDAPSPAATPASVPDTGSGTGEPAP